MENKNREMVVNELLKDQKKKVTELKKQCIDIIEEMRVMNGYDVQIEILSQYIMEKEHLREYEIEYVLLHGIEIGREIEKLNK